MNCYVSFSQMVSSYVIYENILSPLNWQNKSETCKVIKGYTLLYVVCYAFGSILDNKAFKFIPRLNLNNLTF